MRNDSVAKIETADKPELRRLTKLAIDQGHVWPAFQPIVDIRTGTVASFEILARWSDPEAGTIAPSTFIPCLERHGLIDVLTYSLISSACCAAAEWPGDFSLAFNISPVQLLCEDFRGRLAEIIAKTRFPLNRIELEVTEGSLISDDDRAYKVLREFNDCGVRIGIDDFGTGYSSLARLEAFPFHKLKIDARFVSGLDRESSKHRIVAAIIGLGQSLGITIVAEGVETTAEEAILRSLGCDLGQGWLYGTGEPAAKAPYHLKSRGSAARHSRPLDTSPFQQLHQLATLYEQAPVGLCFIDKDLRYVRANERFATMRGMASDQLEGKTIFEVVDGKHLPTIEHTLRAAALSDKPLILRMTFGDHDFMTFNARVKDLTGKLIGFSIVAIDVTEENRLAQELREERDYANAVLDALPGVFYHYGPDLTLQRWNRNLERISSYTADELLGFNPLNFFVEEEKPKIADAIRGVFEAGSGAIEADYLLKDGRRIPYLFTGVRFEHHGAQGFVGVGTDISERKEMEQSLREKTAILEAVIQTALDGLLLVDPGGKKIIQNKRVNELWKIPAEIASNPDGHVQLDYILKMVTNPTEFAERVAWLEAHRDETSFDEIELVDGTLLSRYTTPLSDAEGHYYGRLWAFRDITSRSYIRRKDPRHPSSA